jgi:hypothetical protein
MIGALLTTPVAFTLPGALLLASLALFLFRSIIHLRLGIAAMNGMPLQTFHRRATSYFNISLISVIVFALSLCAIAAMGGGGQLVLIALGFGLALMLWPGILVGFAQRAVVIDADLEETGVIPQGPAPDRGLTAFGYLIVFIGGSGAAWAVAQALSITGLPFIGQSTSLLATGIEGGVLPALLLGALKGGAALLAGFACVTMHARYRAALYAFAAVWLGCSVAEYFVMGDALEALDLSGGAQSAVLVVVLQLAIAFVGPVLAVVLANRRLPDPDAPGPWDREPTPRPEVSLMDQL